MIKEIDPMTGRVWIKWTPAKLRKFEKAYEKARSSPTAFSFQFEGHEFLLVFSAYLIEHLSNQFGNKK